MWLNLLYYSEIIFKNNPDIPVGAPNYTYNDKKILLFGQIVINCHALVNQQRISRVPPKLSTLVKTYGSPGKIKDVFGGANGIIVGFCVLYVEARSIGFAKHVLVAGGVELRYGGNRF